MSLITKAQRTQRDHEDHYCFESQRAQRTQSFIELTFCVRLMDRKSAMSGSECQLPRCHSERSEESLSMRISLTCYEPQEGMRGERFFPFVPQGFSLFRCFENNSSQAQRTGCQAPFSCRRWCSSRGMGNCPENSRLDAQAGQAKSGATIFMSSLVAPTAMAGSPENRGAGVSLPGLGVFPKSSPYFHWRLWPAGS